MYKATDIAALLIELDNSVEEHKDNEPMGLLKLMKLLYYCQGAFLAIKGEPLFSDEIQAWEFGPVVPSVYEVAKDYPAREIYKYGYIFHGCKVDEESKEQVVDVWKIMSLRYTAYELVSKTHQERPWLNATNNGKLLRKQTMPQNEIKDYFKEVYVA